MSGPFENLGMWKKWFSMRRGRRVMLLEKGKKGAIQTKAKKCTLTHDKNSGKICTQMLTVIPGKTE